MSAGLPNDEAFVSAAWDYYYLIDRGYPERGTLKLVGDRYRLNRDCRTILYRGISSRMKSEMRNSMLTDEIEGENLIVDGYNVLFSLLNYRLGRFVFIATDNILRDAGSLHGKIRNESLFEECVKLWFKYLTDHRPGIVEVYLDAPVSHSQKHARLIENMMKQNRINGGCYVVRSADWELKQYEEGIIATSDTAIIDHAGMAVFDLPRHILKEKFDADFISLRALINLSGQ